MLFALLFAPLLFAIWVYGMVLDLIWDFSKIWLNVQNLRVDVIEEKVTIILNTD